MIAKELGVRTKVINWGRGDYLKNGDCGSRDNRGGFSGVVFTWKVRRSDLVFCLRRSGLLPSCGICVFEISAFAPQTPTPPANHLHLSLLLSSTEIEGSKIMVSISSSHMQSQNIKKWWERSQIWADIMTGDPEAEKQTAL